MIGPEFHGGGHPWHGLCRGGSLTLPNAAEKAYPQPSGGDCFKLVVPGFTAPSRSAAQQADDTAQGLQWPVYALLSGDSATGTAGLQMYGKRLGPMRWIWAVSVEEKWLVDASGLALSGGNLAGNLVLTEFGMHWPDGRPPQTRSIAMSVALDTPAAVKMKVLDMSENGTVVLIGLYAYADGSHNAMPMKPAPLAAVKVSLAAVGYSAAASKVYDLADYAAPSRNIYPTTYYNGVPLAVTPYPIGAYLDGGEARQVLIGAQRDTTPPSDVYSRPGWTVRDSRFMLLHDRVADTYLESVCYFDVRVEFQSYLTNPPPPNTVEYIPPTQETITLATESSGNLIYLDYAVTTMVDIQAYGQAQVDAVNAWPTYDAVSGGDYYEENGTMVPSGSTIMTGAACWGNECPTGTPNFHFLSPARKIKSVTVEVTEETVAQGGETYKRAYSRAKIVYDEVNVTLDGVLHHYVGLITYLGKSAYCYYLKINTSGSTGAKDYYLWAGDSQYYAAGYAPPNNTYYPEGYYFGGTQYYHAPNLYEPGAEWPYTYSYTAEYQLLIDGATIPLGSETKLLTLGYDVGFVSRSDMINRLEKGRADRIELYITGRITSPELDRNAAYAEVFFVNPCAGVYGLAFRKILAADASPNLLYKIYTKFGDTVAWSGWGADGPHDQTMSLHPVTSLLARAAPTYPPPETPELPSVPASPVCFV